MWDHVDRWLAGLCSPRTTSGYRAAICRLKEIEGWPDPAAVEDALRLLPAPTVALIRSAGRSYLRYCEQYLGASVVTRDPFCLLRLRYDSTARASKYVPARDVDRLLAAEAAPPLTLAMLLLYFGGLRVTELVSLAVSDTTVDDDGSVLVRVANAKGGRPRTIRLPQRSVAAAVIARKAEALDDAPLVSVGRGGGWSNARTVQRQLGAHAYAVLGRRISPHQLRHAHASHSMTAGAPLHVVQATLGHRTLSATQRYLHAAPHQTSASYLHDIDGAHESLPEGAP